MSGKRLGGTNPIFAHGEAEELVRDLRGFLRAEQVHRQRVEIEAAARMHARATSIVGDLAARLELRFERNAYAFFEDAPDLANEAIWEMFAEFCRRVQDTSPTNELMERKFNFVVKALIVDALRAVCRHNGRTRKGAPDTHGHTVISLEGANERAEAADAGERVVRPAEVADPDAEAEYDAVVDRLLGRRALQWLPHLPPRQRGIVEDRVLAGKEWKDVAARAGISIKWAKQELDEALAALKALLTEQP